MSSTNTAESTKNALNTFGFPKQILLGAIAPESRERVKEVLGRFDSEVVFFDDKTRFEDVFRPDILGGLAEAMLNEGVILRRLKSEIESGHSVFTAHLPQESQAESVAPELYELGASKLSYFGDSVLRRLAPPDAAG